MAEREHVFKFGCGKYLIQYSHSFELLKFRDFLWPFHDLFVFSMTYVKHFLLKNCQNNLLFTRKMRASVYFVTEIKSDFSDLAVSFQLFSLFAFYSQNVYCFSMAFHDP